MVVTFRIPSLRSLGLVLVGALLGASLVAPVVARDTTAVEPAGAAKPVIRKQAPCMRQEGYCTYFVPVPSGIGFNIRSYSFSLPSRGVASVSFTGSMVCSNEGANDSRVVDFATQITTSSSQTADPGGAGGLRHAAVLRSATSDTFNLATTRVIDYSSGGSKSVYFRLDRPRQDAETICYIYDAAFTVVYVPS